MANIWERAPFKSTELLMFLAIADHANDEGIAYPGVKHLAKKCRVEDRRATQIIQFLVSSGAMAVIDTGGGRGKKRVFQIAPFYLPGTGKGAIQDQKGAIPDGKGAIPDTGSLVPSYSESLKNHQLTIEPDVFKTEHQEFWERACEQVLGDSPKYFRDSASDMVLLTEQGDQMKLAVRDAKGPEFYRNRFTKVFERALGGIANRKISIEFVEAT